MDAYKILSWIKMFSFTALLVGLIPYLFIILSTHWSDKVWSYKRIIKAVLYRIPFQVEITKLGKFRWFSHFLIFVSFIWFFLFYWISTPFRMSLFVHDLFVALFGIGIALAFLRRLKKNVISQWEDYYSLFLLLIIWLSGLLTEIAKIQYIHPDFRGKFWLGDFFAGLLSAVNLTIPFTPLLMVHIVFTGLFIASIPFTKLFHILFLPLKEIFGESYDTGS